ncbi:UBA domain-containing protein Mud1 [Dictyocoela muelleri]|nr:UBA domain-containing protein Mud1 [Dictyocoela muelleri]
MQRKTNEALINGLPDDLLLKYSELGIYDAEKIIERISETEKLILALEESKKSSINNIELSESNTEPIKRKWCRFHKSKTHDDKDCIAQKSNQTKIKNGKEKPKINNIKLYTLPYIFFNLLDGHIVKALVDSGASFSFINSNICRKLNLFPSKCKPITIKVANGNTCNINEKVELRIYLSDIDETIKLQTFVLNGLNEEMVLGNDFINQNEIILETAKNLIRYKQHEIPLNKHTKISLLNANSEQLNHEQEIKLIIANYNKKINPKISIKNLEFKIP